MKNTFSSLCRTIKDIFDLQKAVIAIMIVVFLSLSWTYYLFIKSTKKTFDNIKLSEIQNMKNLSTIIDKTLRYYLSREHKIHNLTKERILSILSKDRKLYNKLNDILSLYITKTTRYIYVIYKDKKGRYRYMLDGSLPKSERGAFGQIFIPVNTELWEKCFREKKDVYGIQSKETYGLWVTYLHPLIFDGKVQAILALDVSSKIYTKLENIFAPIRQYLKYMLIFIFVIILCILVETLLLFREQKKRRLDALTGLYNRSYLKEIEKAIDLKEIAVALVDVDFFKKINDTYGHDYGDLVLRSVAKQLMLYSRNYDIVIRYGGEEFLVIFKNYNGYKSKEDIKNIIKVAKRIQRKISSNPVRLNDIEINVTISMGIDPFTYKRKSLVHSITMADKALYIAKNTGRNRVVVAKFNDNPDT